MALTPNDLKHALQIQAGILGRNTGHKFEATLAGRINKINAGIQQLPLPKKLIYGNPEIEIIKKGLSVLGWKNCDKVEAIALGSLATADGGKQWLQVHGVVVNACKSDILLTLHKKLIMSN